MAFDGNELDAGLRRDGVANGLAFVNMGLDDRGASHFAHQLRDACLERTGDYDALSVLAFYQVYRAMVRAKVNALQAHQHPGQETASRSLEHAEAYLRLAASYTGTSRPTLALMHGVSGTGKSTLTRELIDRYGTIRLRSDVVRKQLFGLRPEQSSAAAGVDIYSGQASRRTYERLLGQARTALEAGYSVVVDATFLRHVHRMPFQELAEELDVPCRIVSLQGERETLRSRVRQRGRAGNDPSEADVEVLDAQLRELEPLTREERSRAVILDIEAIPADWHRRLSG
jgi:predicted kinase